MWQELRLAFRSLIRTPAFTIIGIVTLALAIGANTAVVSLVNGLLIRPLAYHAPDRLVLLWEQFKTQGLDRIPSSAPEYLDYEKQQRSFERIAAFNYEAFNLTAGDIPERIQGATVSPSLFPLLGIQPIKGRFFSTEEQGVGHDGVVVISQRLWQRRFNSNPGLIGTKLLLNGQAYTVIGIMPSKFEFPLPLFNVQGGQFVERAEIWKPVAFTDEEMKARYSRSYGIIARLRDGVSIASAQAELDTITSNWKRQYPNFYSEGSGFGGKLYSLQEQVVGGMRNGLLILLGAVGLVLLIACANLTTMLLARSSTREREFAIRVALGAGPLRVLRQTLTESVLLGLIGGSAGVLLAIWGLDLLKLIGGQNVPRLQEVNIDLVVLAATLVISVGTGILFGFAPALAMAKPELTEALKQGGRGSTSGGRRNNLRNALVIAEMALALVLLIGAGLLMKSFVRLQNVNPGFNPRNVLTAEIVLPELKYPSADGTRYMGGKGAIDFFAELNRRIRTLPGVECSASTLVLPLSGTNTDSSFNIEGRTVRPDEPGPDEEIRTITPDYFKVLQTPLQQGRFFTDADNADAPLVVIVNEAFAEKYWPNSDALGKRITFDSLAKGNPKWITIVGIVGNVRHRALELESVPEYYFPHAQQPLRAMILTVRSTQDPRSLTAAVRRELQAIDPDQPLARVRTLEQVISESVAPRRFSVVLLGVFAGVALLLATVGIYGVMSYLVVQRTHEIGVRMALGAQRADVLKLVIGHSLKLVAVGIGFGLLMAVCSARALSTLLYAVGAFDVGTFVLVALVLSGAALLASYIPALRATRADPMIALSHNG